MSDEQKDPPILTDEMSRKWFAEVRTAVADIEAVTEDVLRPERDRDLGVREATRLYNDAHDKLAKLFAYAAR
jgi:hypothetical protein